MRIVIRVDSSNLIGSGHLMRCLTLAEQQRKTGDAVSFVCRDLDGNMSKLVQERGFDLVLLPNNKSDEELTGYAKWLTVSQERDACDTIKVIKKMGKVHRVVVDSYAIDETWEKMVRPYSDEIFVIDDLADRKHDCDILLDQNFYLNKENRYHGLVPQTCELLLGPEYALLREEFSAAKAKMQSRQGYLRNILVFYGGVDFTDETSKAVMVLSGLMSADRLPDVKVTVVVGGSNSKKESVAYLCQKAGFKYLCQVDNMAELMAEADLMLGAGGATTWERCYLGLPAIVTAVAENQYKICEDCSAAGFIYYLGHWDEVRVEDIHNAVMLFTNPQELLSMQKKMSQIFS